MADRTGFGWGHGAGLAFVALVCACGGVSEGEKHGRGAGTNGGAGGTSGGTAGTNGGTSGMSGGTGGTTEPECTAGDVRCNAALHREECSADGVWDATDFVCARTVAVDDETASICVTKGDGSYRCWGGNPGDALPDERYQRVQLGGQGLIGLTEDGRLLAAEVPIPEGLAPIAQFRATLMGSEQGICSLFADGAFGMVIGRFMLDGTRTTELAPIDDGPFLRAFCAWEGLIVGVRTDGSLWGTRSEFDMPGVGWRDVAMSTTILCGIKNDGSVACLPPFFSCRQTTIEPCVGAELPTFPNGVYRSITATSNAVCAVDATDTVVCKRYDGEDMPIDAGRYRFVEGGLNVLCALRIDGTTACFDHGGSNFPSAVDSFVPLEPGIDPEW